MNTAIDILFKDNDLELAIEVSDLLLELCRILKPQELGLKILPTISTSSEAFRERLLQASGAVDIIFLLGFQEGNNCFYLPREENVTSAAQQLQQLLQPAREHAIGTLLSLQTLPQPIAFNVLPLPSNKTEATLISEMISMLSQVQCHEDHVLQEKALKVLPLEELTARAKRKQQTSEGSATTAVSWKDWLLLELLSWYKESFFRWVDTPPCPWCGDATSAIKASSATLPQPLDLHWGASRVESYVCPHCLANVRFPRYNAPGRLLFTRRGRCGEWANCFLLFLRALKFQARLVNDSQDHVWTEAYSESQSRWLHCDPCENQCDIPLLYQDGWKKTLLYVWAYAHDHVQDVTWRYSSQHRLLVQQRKIFRESFLLSLLDALCIRLQPDCENIKNRLLLMKLKELVEFLTPGSTSRECDGRSSGSLSWRLARGEASGQAHDTLDKSTGFIFTPTSKEDAAGQMIISYSSATDKYQRPLSGYEDLKGWANGVWESRGIFRKEERDWQKVYLCAQEGSAHGSLTWRFHIPSGVTSVSLLCDNTTFQKGKVQLTLSNGIQVHQIQNGELQDTLKFLGAQELVLCAELFSGDFWQHAQLFRMDTNHVGAQESTKIPFHVCISFHSNTPDTKE